MWHNGEKRNEKATSNLVSSYNKKVKELENVETIVSAYKNDLRELIQEAFDMENVEIAEIYATIKVHEEEITKLNKLMVLNSKTKDIIEIEKDKSKVKNLKDEIKDIKFRISFDKSPDEIYDEIEMILGSIGYVDNVRKTRSEKFTFEKIENPIFKLQESKEEIASQPIITENPVIKEIQTFEEFKLPVKEEALEPKTKTAEVKEEELPVFEGPIREVKSTRLRVVEIIPIDSNEEQHKEEEQEDFMINDFEDTGYIGFEDAIAKASNKGESVWD